MTRYQLEFHLNADHATVHMSVRTGIDRYASWGPEAILSDKNPPEWARTLLDITGVVGVYAKPYAVSITKATAFEWSDILPIALYALQTQFAVDGWEQKPDIRWSGSGDTARRLLPVSS